MGQSMVVADTSVEYQLKEGAMIIVALFWVLALGSVLFAAWFLCGWRGAKKVDFDWRRLRVIFWCR